MIQPNELRIGNFVLVKPVIGNDKSFKSLKVSANEIYRCNNNPKDFNPIPITPEVLEKCGFEKIGGYYSKSPIIFHEYYIEIEANDTSYRGSIVPLYNCKYLHQLQNLYFALTGEELEYKP